MEYQLPEWARYMALDADGFLMVYSHLPTFDYQFGEWYPDDEDIEWDQEVYWDYEVVGYVMNHEDDETPPYRVDIPVEIAAASLVEVNRVADTVHEVPPPKVGIIKKASRIAKKVVPAYIKRKLARRLL